MSESPWTTILSSKNRYRLIDSTTSLPSGKQLFPTRPRPDMPTAFFPASFLPRRVGVRSNYWPHKASHLDSVPLI